MGHALKKDLNRFWKEVDVFISLAEFESHGHAPRKSIAIQVPIIALESFGIRDLVESEVGG